MKRPGPFHNVMLAVTITNLCNQLIHRVKGAKAVSQAKSGALVTLQAVVLTVGTIVISEKHIAIVVATNSVYA